MNKILKPLLLAFLVSTAGCSGFLDQGNQSPPPTTSTPQATSSNNNPVYSESTDTGSIVLRISDLPSGYEFRGEVDQSPKMDTDTASELREQNILRQHQRSFIYNSTEQTDLPVIIISSVIIYENQRAANSQFQQSIVDLTEGNGTSETREIVSGSTATIVKFENERGGKVVLIHSQRQNMGFYIATLSTQEYREEFTTEQYIKMLVDLS
jgi:hypothetical protein